MNHDTLPNSIAVRSSKTVVWANGMKWIPLFCANCSKEGPHVLETELERVNNWAFYLCEPCAEKWSPMVDMCIEPDQAFWRKAHEAQFEKYGRLLEPDELVEVLKDDTNTITRLCKDRHDFKKAN
jgi:protein-arginine kinase activator protein McsA